MVDRQKKCISKYSGRIPATAAELFLYFDEDERERADIPWMHGAEKLTLPVAAPAIKKWKLPGKFLECTYILEGFSLWNCMENWFIHMNLMKQKQQESIEQKFKLIKPRNCS